jgi:hypothetical protein
MCSPEVYGYPAASSLQRVYDDVIPYTHIRKNIFIVYLKITKIFFYTISGIWYTGTTLLLIETRSLAVHEMTSSHLTTVPNPTPNHDQDEIFQFLNYLTFLFFEL